MPIHTRRWNDAAQPDEGQRILITRYRPRGLAKSEQTWDLWMPHLGPSKQLHAAVYGKIGSGIPWTVYLSQYRAEMKLQVNAIQGLARQVAAGQTLTLLCSNQCDREARCHRSVLKDLILAEVQKLS